MRSTRSSELQTKGSVPSDPEQIVASGSQIKAEDEQIRSDTKDETMEKRKEKMRELRKKMADSTKANRKAVATETNQHKHSNRIKTATARKLERAERLLDERDALERGEDFQRSKSWQYTIEENDRWEEKMQEKEAKKDQGYLDAQSASERTYNRLIGQIKPEKNRSTHSANTHQSSSDPTVSSTQNRGLQYGSHKPDDSALDRVAAHLNAEADVRSKRSRQRAEDPDAGVDYINNKNKHYNKKIKRFFDQHVGEIRDSFERGTAL